MDVFLGRFNADHECVPDGLACTEPLGIVHTSDVDGKRVAVAEIYDLSPLDDLVLETPPPDYVVLGVRSVSPNHQGLPTPRRSRQPGNEFLSVVPTKRETVRRDGLLL